MQMIIDGVEATIDGWQVAGDGLFLKVGDRRFLMEMDTVESSHIASAFDDLINRGTETASGTMQEDQTNEGVTTIARAKSSNWSKVRIGDTNYPVPTPVLNEMDRLGREVSNLRCPHRETMPGHRIPDWAMPLAGRMLRDYADSLGNRGCNDWDPPKGVTHQEVLDAGTLFSGTNEYRDGTHAQDWMVCQILAMMLDPEGETKVDPGCEMCIEVKRRMEVIDDEPDLARRQPWTKLRVDFRCNNCGKCWSSQAPGEWTEMTPERADNAGH